MLREFRLRSIRIKQQDKLNSRNLALYKVITNNIQNSDLRSVEKEEILQDILDMMLQIQMEDKPVEVIVGDDYREFCNNIVNEYLMSKPRIYKVLSFLQKYIILMIIISFFMSNQVKSGLGIHGLGIPVDKFIYANAIALFIIPFTRKSNRRSLCTPMNSLLYIRGGNDNSKLLKIWGFTIIGIVSIKLFLKNITGIDMGNYNIQLFSYLPAILALLIMAGSIEIYKRVYDKK